MAIRNQTFPSSEHNVLLRVFWFDGRATTDILKPSDPLMSTLKGTELLNCKTLSMIAILGNCQPGFMILIGVGQ